MAIKFYKPKDTHGHMSNFYKSKFYYDGRWWKTSEHAYQAAKTYVPEEVEEICNAPTPKIARDLGQKCKFRSDFNDIRYEKMKDIVLQKYLQNQDIYYKLIETGDELLIEDSPVDYYWGCGADGSGQNMLGKVLMEIRAQLKEWS